MSDQAPERQPEQPADSADTLPRGRRHPSTLGGLVYLVVLAVTLVSIVVVTSGSWRLGIQTMAGALGAGALLRLVLPQREAGMLAVRSRALDVVLLAALGGLLWFLAGSIPDQPTL